MSEKDLGAQNKEQTALELFKIVAAVEGKVLNRPGNQAFGDGYTGADKAYVLQTYAACLSVVKGGRA